MKKLKIKNKLIYFVLMLIVLILFALLILFIKLKNNSIILKNKNDKFYPYIFYQNINNIESYFLNRKTLIKNESNTILVGRKQKEIENDYYDLKFDINEYALYITINNLQKEDRDFRNISVEYLNELTIFLSMLLNNENIDELVNIIKEEYLNLRNNNECFDNKYSYKQINIDQYFIDFNIESNMIKIKIENMR